MGGGCSRVIVDVSTAGNMKGMMASAYVPALTANDEVIISCKHFTANGRLL